ncbi:MAG TPA: spore coat protein U domain-containing protein [Ramlibacter sp.]|jgi:hypothetical protein|nr:spore coat protein U domain-containing protein [Ramlibacter sp.]
MSKWQFKGIIAALIAAGATATFSAQENRTLSVTATIPGACTLTTSGAMGFGELDMSSTGNETKQVTVTYKCATGLTVASFTVGGSNTGTYAGVMAGLTPGNTDTIPYSLTWTPPAAYAGQGFAVTGQQVTLTGTVLNGNYISKAPDSYAHSVVLSINY